MSTSESSSPVKSVSGCRTLYSGPEGASLSVHVLFEERGLVGNLQAAAKGRLSFRSLLLRFVDRPSVIRIPEYELRSKPWVQRLPDEGLRTIVIDSDDGIGR